MSKEPENKTHGRALRAFRIAAGLTQSGLAEVLGRSTYQWVGDLECGRRGLYELSPDDVGRLEVATGRDAHHLRVACMEAFAERHPWGAALLSRSRHARKGAPMADG